ncbi:MAG: response regulator transcription factor [Hyphomicrobiaceae bacterium]|nr:response regulator transcription factor [Hyphomicrobiaceae bacterium]
MRALLICQNAASAFWLQTQLAQLGYALDVVGSPSAAGEAAYMVDHVDYDVIVWDIDGAPAAAPSDLLSLIRPSQHGGVLILSEASGLDRVADALAAGASDFVLKPIDARQLNLRLGCLAQRQQSLRRSGSADHLRICTGRLCLNLETRTITFNDVPIVVTPRERGILETLICSNGGVVSKERIASRIYAIGDEAMPRSIETYVHRLRKKLARLPVEIATVRGQGYCLRVETQTETSGPALRNPDRD